MVTLPAFTSSINTTIYQVHHEEKNMVFNTPQKALFFLYVIWLIVRLFDKGENLLLKVIIVSIIFGGLIWSLRNNN